MHNTYKEYTCEVKTILKKNFLTKKVTGGRVEGLTDMRDLFEAALIF